MIQRPKGFPRSAWFHMSQTARWNALWFIYWACATKLKLTYGRIENASLQ